MYVLLQPKTKQKNHKKMKNTNPIFSLKNFRSFGEESADFELAPITVLTGCNSAGKSSMVKALLLLSKQSPLFTTGGESVSRNLLIDLDIDDNDRLRCTAGADIKRCHPSKELKVFFKELCLGGYDKVINSQAKDDTITMSYQIWSDTLQEAIIVKRIFGLKQDNQNRGILKAFSIEKLNGAIIYRYFWNSSEETISFVDPEVGSVEFNQIIGWDEEEYFNAISDNYSPASKAFNHFNMLRFKLKVESIKKKRMEMGLSDRLPKKIEDRLKEINDNLEEIEKNGVNLSNNVHLIEAMNYIYSHDKDVDYEDSHSMEEKNARMQNNYLNNVINECITPWFLQNIAYIDSSTANVKRHYSEEDHDKLSGTLGKLVKYGETGLFVNKWLEKFGIAKSIKIKIIDDGLLKVYLVNGEEEKLLADEGYGITQLVSLLLQIDNIIKGYTATETTLENSDNSYYDEVKYVDSHLRHIIAVEEPEVHLHPKYQSLLADMFVEAYQNYSIHFIIETHSEYLIRKLQVLVADKENKLTPNDVSLNYVDKDENGISTNRKIEILEDGRLSEPFGPGFFDEATGLSMHLLKMKMGSK